MRPRRLRTVCFGYVQIKCILRVKEGPKDMLIVVVATAGGHAEHRPPAGRGRGAGPHAQAARTNDQNKCVLCPRAVRRKGDVYTFRLCVLVLS